MKIRNMIYCCLISMVLFSGCTKKENKFEKLIFFGKEDNIKCLNKDYCVEFFLDVTFDIIPVKYRPYKLMVLSGLPISKKPITIMFVLIKYLDYISYDRVLNYLTENFKFNPKIIHSDFEGAISKAIAENKYFGKDIIHLRCFFHLAQMIRNKLNRLHLLKIIAQGRITTPINIQ